MAHAARCRISLSLSHTLTCQDLARISADLVTFAYRLRPIVHKSSRRFPGRELNRYSVAIATPVSTVSGDTIEHHWLGGQTALYRICVLSPANVSQHIAYGAC